MFTFGCSSCASLPQIEADLDLSKQPPVDVQIENVEVKSTFFNFTKIIRMKGHVNISQHGWRIKGFQVVYSELKGKSEYLQSFKRKIQTYYETDMDGQRDAEQSIIDPGQIQMHEIRLIFERTEKKQISGRVPIDFEFETGAPWGHNFCIFEINKQRFFEYWYRMK
ncbi:hypothetical protein [Turneriella parva]|nr:hypothetical protein [Turneriella parva]